jgi:hypothetical protein
MTGKPPLHWDIGPEIDYRDGKFLIVFLSCSKRLHHFISGVFLLSLSNVSFTNDTNFGTMLFKLRTLALNNA